MEGTEQPWTRITETADGSGSTWTGGERIGVRIANGDPGTYTVQADGTVSPVTPAYWQSTAATYVYAWYPLEETVSLADQTGGLAYVLQTPDVAATYGQPVSLSFTHKLAKVRVVLGGTQAGQVTQVEVNNYTQCSNNKGSLAYNGNDQGWIKMHQADATTWEANVIPGSQIDPANFIRLNGTAMATNLTGLPSMLGAGQMYTVSLTVGEPVLQDGATLTEPGTYTMQGTYTQGITIQGDGITVVMDGATVSTSGIGINVQSDATIQVQGADNTITSGSAGIYVAEGSTVTIEGSGRDDQLTARGGNGGAGIGGCLSSPYNEVSCGNITIRNVTVYSYGSIRGDMAAGIGSIVYCYTGTGDTPDKTVVYDASGNGTERP